MQVAEKDNQTWPGEGPKLNAMITDLGRLMCKIMPILAEQLPLIIGALMKKIPAGSGEDMKARMGAVLVAVKGIAEAAGLVKPLLDTMPPELLGDADKLDERIKSYFGPEGKPKEGLIYKMIVPMSAAIGDSLDLILKGSSAIAAGDIASLEPRMKIINDAVSGIAKMGGLVVSLMGMGNAPAPASNKLEEVIASTMAEDITTKAEQVKDSIVIIMGAMAGPGGIATVIGSIIELTSHPDIQKAGAGTNIDIVGKALGAAATFVKVISDVIKLVPPAVSASDLYNKMTWLFGANATESEQKDSIMGKIADGIARHLPAIVNSITGIKIPEGVDKAKIDVITSALQGVGYFTSAITTMMSTFGGGGKKPLTMAETDAFIRGMFGKPASQMGTGEDPLKSPLGIIVAAITHELPPLVQAIAGIPVGSKTHASRIKNIVAALDAVVKFSDAMSTLSTAFPGAKLPGGEDPVQLQSVAEEVFPSLKDTVKAVKENLPDLLECLMEMVTTGPVSKIGSHIGKIITVGKVFPVLKDFAAAMTQIQGLNVDGAGVAHHISEITTAIQGQGGEAGRGIQGIIEALVGINFDKGGLEAAYRGMYWFNLALGRIAKTLTVASALTIGTVFDPVKKSIDTFSGIPDEIAKALEADQFARGGDITARAKVFCQAMAQIDKAFDLGKLSDSTHIAHIMNSIASMNGLLDGDMSSGAAVVAAFSKGDLVVHHNLPNTTVTVNVNLSTKKLAKAVTTVPLDGGKIRPT